MLWVSSNLLRTCWVSSANMIRKCNINQYSLLICDAHVSRRNSTVLQILRANNIDMLVLPAHVTSVVQLLDIGVFTLYKEYVRKFFKDTGGLYHLLYASAGAFTVDNAWKEFLLFSRDWKAFLQSFPEQLLMPSKRKSRSLASNFVVTSFNTSQSNRRSYLCASVPAMLHIILIPKSG